MVMLHGIGPLKVGAKVVGRIVPAMAANGIGAGLGSGWRGMITAGLARWAQVDEPMEALIAVMGGDEVTAALALAFIKSVEIGLDSGEIFIGTPGRANDYASFMARKNSLSANLTSGEWGMSHRGGR